MLIFTVSFWPAWTLFIIRCLGGCPAAGKEEGKATEVDGPVTAEVDGPEAAEMDGPEAAEVDGPEAAEVDGPETAEVDGPVTAAIVDLDTVEVEGPRASCLPHSGGTRSLEAFSLAVWYCFLVHQQS